MTPEEIERMPAGRELDALIAEKVMGFKWRTSKHSGYRYLFPPGHRSNLFTDSIGNEPLYGDWDDCVPAYSTDIAAAWQVVEKLCADAHNFSFDSGAFGPGSDWQNKIDKWTVCFDDYTTVEVHSYAPTMPLAICRAALLATLQDNGK
jgi:hypothetical protein